MIYYENTGLEGAMIVGQLLSAAMKISFEGDMRQLPRDNANSWFDDFIAVCR